MRQAARDHRRQGAAQADHALHARLTLHGTFVEVFSLGVLLEGPPGSGKSTLALELVARGHRLIGDDAVELTRPAADILVAQCPELLRGFLHVPELGVLDVARLYGDAAIAPAQRLDLIVDVARPGERGARDLLGVTVPVVHLRHNQGVLIEAACRDHWLRLFGYRSDEEFSARQQAAVLRDQGP